MKQYAENNKIGVCHSLRNEDMYIKSFSGGYPYLDNGAIARSTAEKPIHSYGKNYEKDGKEFALFIWTTNGDAKEVETLLDKASKKVTDKNIESITEKGAFIYL